MIKAKIIDINRLRPDIDGDGIVTLITLRGCPLHCRYCLNNYCYDEQSVKRVMTANKWIEILKIDDIYFRMSGGGVTFGGGEPLLQVDFIAEFLETAPKYWKIRMETSLNCEWKQIELLTAPVDQWIIDMKDMNPEIYLS